MPIPFSIIGLEIYHNEPFMKHISWIDQLKIRGSYGQTGNDNLGSSLYGTFSLAAQYIKFSNNSVTYVPICLAVLITRMLPGKRLP